MKRKCCKPRSRCWWIFGRIGAARAGCLGLFWRRSPGITGSLRVGKVNVDEQLALAQRFGVSSIPLLILFKNGRPVAKALGYRPKAEIQELLKDL